MSNVSILNLPFKALSDPTRRKIILLLRHGELTAGEISKHFNITKPTISHHLNALKQSLLITNKREGQHIYYFLNASVFQEVTNWFLETTYVTEEREVNKNHNY